MGPFSYSVVLQLLALSYFFTFPSNQAFPITRGNFPTGFIFGAASSAYQYEGAAYKDGRGPSIWDTFTKTHPEKIVDRSSGERADDFYYRYKEDVALLKEIGFDYFRFSISWPRILPRGKISRGVNKEGVQFYNNLIDELLSNGLQPAVTLFHWDTPQALEDEYGGFLSPSIVDDYKDYVEFCFKEFGDRVKFWITLNEPNFFASWGYASGTKAPGRCSNYIGNCSVGNSATEPYIVAHNMILAHATAVKLYRNKFQESQKGKIGITVATRWMVPKFHTTNDFEASLRALDFAFGWIVDPIMFGDYPKSMQSLVGKRLPKFSKDQSELVKGSIDFLGANYYTARYAEDSTNSNHTKINFSYTTDSLVNLTTEKDGIPIGQPTSASWFYIYPKGIEEYILYLKTKYNNPPIYITENGIVDENSSAKLEDALNDGSRIKYHHDHLSHLLQAIKGGADVRGYFAWSLLDNFEWESGYTVRFGMTYVDYNNNLQRYNKNSALWFKKFLQNKDNLFLPQSFLFHYEY
ncbi:hypothetical protein UlMin_004947 [Ulmus minor]